MSANDATPTTPTSQPPPPRILRIKRKRGQDPLQALILEDTRIVKRSKPSTPVASPIETPRSQTPSNQQQQQKLSQSGISTDNDRLNYMFKLAKTEFGDDAQLDESVLHTILAEAATTTSAASGQHEGAGQEVSQEQHKTGIKRRFIIQPDETRRRSTLDYENAADAKIPDQLFNMIEDIVSKGDDNSNAKRKRRGRTGSAHEEEPSFAGPNPHGTSTFQNTTNSNEQGGNSNNSPNDDDNEDNQYVYDVYQLTDAEPLTTANHPSAQIGYIRFFNDDESDNDDSNIFDSTQQEADDLRKPGVLTDDEDSNAESFYQNDYPSDEDAEGLQELNSFEDEFDKLNIGGGGDGDEDGHVADGDEGYVPHDGIGWNGEEYFDYGDVERFMGFDEEDDDDDDDEDDGGDEEDYPVKRNQFFKSDVNDPLALHRDKIFGKLEKMINKQ
ncbi:hypothetical protein KGF57_003537 [Candida theae]|uniref:Transcription factor Iwr1 domain-containing protein n=1 Tax=Candida theae TaxID=1198502 RepID=A0AAD5BCZ3_9ASCO|nr:uncharacterized protein KGF57_003537 [Candida theae]KAI5956051.1 hypothetical protein KGF57_003537 [Candida theae]